MRTLKQATVAVVTAGSLAFLGAGVAHADSAKVHKAKPKQVSVKVNQVQNCSYRALVPINVAIANQGSSVGSFTCTQSGSIG